MQKYELAHCVFPPRQQPGLRRGGGVPALLVLCCSPVQPCCRVIRPGNVSPRKMHTRTHIHVHCRSASRQLVLQPPVTPKWPHHNPNRSELLPAPDEKILTTSKYQKRIVLATPMLVGRCEHGVRKIHIAVSALKGAFRANTLRATV